MNQKDIIEFFDACAPQWDAHLVRNDKILNRILDVAGISEGIDVLDVACGTGVLFPYYAQRNIKSLVGIDVSPKMCEIAAKNFPDVTIICDDAQTHEFEKQFDAVVIYNAFPHFVDAQGLIKSLAAVTKVGGKFTIAHGMSREALKKHHERVPHVSAELPEAAVLAQMLEPYFNVDVVVSNNETYIVSGVRKVF